MLVLARRDVSRGTLLHNTVNADGKNVMQKCISRVTDGSVCADLALLGLAKQIQLHFLFLTVVVWPMFRTPVVGCWVNDCSASHVIKVLTLSLDTSHRDTMQAWTLVLVSPTPELVLYCKVSSL